MGTIHVPNRVKDLSDRDRLVLRFERFMAATGDLPDGGELDRFARASVACNISLWLWL